MKAVVSWVEGMKFKSEAGNNNLHMDSKPPLGKDQGPTPKELIAMGLGGCTAMDVIALLKKFKQLPESFLVNVDITTSQGVQPAVFDKAHLTFVATGSVEADKFLDAVHRSQTQYCGVSAMLAKAFPISYTVELNGTQIGTGEAKF